MHQQDLDKILEQHILWLQDSTKGKRANLHDAGLRGADLRNANLCSANLRNADLCSADLCNANLRDANLCGADLRYANLRNANLRDTDLRGADLRHANLCGTDLRYADLCFTFLNRANLDYANLSNTNLSDADLREANLCNADLNSADLRHADLRFTFLNKANLCYANLRYTNLYDTDLRDADLSNTIGLNIYNICSEGTLIGWKKTIEGNILKLQIPASAKRCNKLGSRKCRANKAKVLGLYSVDKKQLKFDKSQHSLHSSKFTYNKGQLLEVPDFCDDIRVECAPGIHFFITFEEAVRY